MTRNKSMIIDNIKFLIPTEDDNRMLFNRFPYESSDPLKVMKYFDVRFPFEAVIDKTKDGLSRCKTCGTVYSGYQYTCSMKHKFWTCIEKLSKKVEVSRQFLSKNVATDYMKNNGIAGKPKRLLEKCRGGCEWNLEKIFLMQKDFFDAMAALSDLVDKYKEGDVSSLLKYKSYFPDELAIRLELEYLRDQVTKLSKYVEILGLEAQERRETEQKGK